MIDELSADQRLVERPLELDHRRRVHGDDAAAARDVGLERRTLRHVQEVARAVHQDDRVVTREALEVERRAVFTVREGPPLCAREVEQGVDGRLDRGVPVARRARAEKEIESRCGGRNRRRPRTRGRYHRGTFRG